MTYRAAELLLRVAGDSPRTADSAFAASGANAYDFAEQLLATQRKFAEDALRATAPGRGPGAGKPLPAAHSRR